MENNELLRKIEKLEREMAELKASRGLRGFMRRAFTRSSMLAGVILAALIASVVIYAGTVTKPYTFVDGTVISAEQVNDNFDTLYDLVNGNINDENVDSLDASKIATGTIDHNRLPGVWVATGLGPGDGTDSGQITSRVLTFTKYHDSTAIRIGYCDSWRLLSYAYGRWKIYIDGNPPASGELNYYLHSSTSATSLDIHRPVMVIGYVTGLAAGDHTISIVIEHLGGSTSDYYTGWNDARWTIEAQELNIN